MNKYPNPSALEESPVETISALQLQEENDGWVSIDNVKHTIHRCPITVNPKVLSALLHRNPLLKAILGGPVVAKALTQLFKGWEDLYPDTATPLAIVRMVISGASIYIGYKAIREPNSPPSLLIITWEAGVGSLRVFLFSFMNTLKIYNATHTRDETGQIHISNGKFWSELFLPSASLAVLYFGFSLTTPRQREQFFKKCINPIASRYARHIFDFMAGTCLHGVVFQGTLAYFTPLHPEYTYLIALPPAALVTVLQMRNVLNQTLRATMGYTAAAYFVKLVVDDLLYNPHVLRLVAAIEGYGFWPLAIILSVAITWKYFNDFSEIYREDLDCNFGELSLFYNPQDGVLDEFRDVPLGNPIAAPLLEAPHDDEPWDLRSPASIESSSEEEASPRERSRRGRWDRPAKKAQSPSDSNDGPNSPATEISAGEGRDWVRSPSGGFAPGASAAVLAQSMPMLSSASSGAMSSSAASPKPLTAPTPTPRH